jgi:hypothetical protein
MVILVKRIKMNFKKFDEMHDLFKMAVDSVPKDEFISTIRVSRDRHNDEYLVAVFPYHADSNMTIKGFDKITGYCQSCANYGGAFTHSFTRGEIGNCVDDGQEHSPIDQCEYYVDKKNMEEEFRKVLKNAHDERNKKIEQAIPYIKESLESIKKSMESIISKEKNDDEVDPNEQL